MTYTESSKNSTNKYRAKFDIIQIRLDQGEREKISEHAKRCGESMNAFIKRAIKTMIETDEKADL